MIARMLTIAGSALTWLLVLMLAGMALSTTGVYVLLGPGYALVAAGGMCFGAAGFVLRGLTRA